MAVELTDGSRAIIQIRPNATLTSEIEGHPRIAEIIRVPYPITANAKYHVDPETNETCFEFAFTPRQNKPHFVNTEDVEVIEEATHELRGQLATKARVVMTMLRTRTFRNAKPDEEAVQAFADDMSVLWHEDEGDQVGWVQCWLDDFMGYRVEESRAFWELVESNRTVVEVLEEMDNTYI